MSPVRSLSLALALMAPCLASAQSATLAPLLRRSGVTTSQTQNLSDLISSELDFMPEFDDFNEGATSPPNSGCLGSTSCLKGLAGDADRLITGTVSLSGGNYALDLVYYSREDNRIIRRSTYRVGTGASEAADAMNGIVSELVTGKTRQAARESEPAIDDFDFDEGGGSDDAFDFDDFDPEQALLTAQKAERDRAEREAIEKKAREDERRAEMARRTAEAERLAEQELAQRRAEQERQAAAEQARREAEQRAASREVVDFNDPDAFDADSISFVSPADDEISIEDLNSISFAPTTGLSQSTPSADLDLDLDEPNSRGRSSSSRSSQPKRAQQPSAPHSVQIALRGGYSPYGSLNFLTFGAEVAVPLSGDLHLVAGFEAYSVQRSVPVDRQQELQIIAMWNTIYPFNAGLIYKIPGSGPVTPYIGADLIAAQYLVDGRGQSYWAIGGRVRFGADIALTSRVELSLNAAVGAWQGKNWSAIQTGLPSIALLPQLSGGLIVNF